MKYSEYPAATSLVSTDILLADGSTGTKKITVADFRAAIDDIVDPGIPAAAVHRRNFRGKNLGTSLTTTQSSAIQSGKFTDIWLGDYWVINGVNWRVADFDYFYNIGDTRTTKHHLVIVPDTGLYAAQFNTATINAGGGSNGIGGYPSTAMWNSNLNSAKTSATNAFGAAVLSHRVLHVTAIAPMVGSDAAWYDATVDLMNEAMVYGHPQLSIMSSSAQGLFARNSESDKLALFDAHPYYRNLPSSGLYWLRNIINGNSVAIVSNGGHADMLAPTDNTAQVRPYFLIGS